jgi:cell division protein FtsI/penicillin-binding protein 2
MPKIKNKALNQWRLWIIVGGVFFFWLLLEINLYHIQIRKHNYFSTIAQKQYIRKMDLPAQRGAIRDRNGSVLASSSIHYDLAVDPQMVQNPKRIAKQYAKVFQKPAAHYLAKMKKRSRFVYLERKAPEAKIKNLIAINDNGMIKRDNFRRNYPYQNIASQLIGFTDPDDKGLGGIELEYENILQGVDGEAMLLKDAPGKRFYFDADNAPIKPQRGQDVFLTIDKNIQTVLDEELENGVKNAKAQSGMAIVMDPFSGAVLAMANYPGFNPNRHTEYKTENKRNKTITDSFEPGSTIKMITASVLLQEKLTKITDFEYCENGEYKVHDRVFRDVKKYGYLTFQKIIEKSSNIGIIKLSGKMKNALLFRYLINFGFGAKTGVNLSGEAEGLITRPNQWSGVSKASISIGYNISVTALQLTSAYAAMVNGGYLYKPYVVSHIKDKKGNLKEIAKPELVRQVLSPEVSEILKKMMVSAVENGTGKLAAVNNIKVGGKTGTAKKFNHKTGKYDQTKYTTSFVGFAGYESPKYVCAVIINTPSKGSSGGAVAAPVFAKIINRIYNFDSGTETELKEDHFVLTHNMNTLPNIIGFSIKPAISILNEKKIKYHVSGAGDIVVNAELINGEMNIQLGNTVKAHKKIPDLRGLSLKEAMGRVDFTKLRITLAGSKSGSVVSQSIQPGTRIKPYQNLTLTCR